MLVQEVSNNFAITCFQEFLCLFSPQKHFFFFSLYEVLGVVVGILLTFIKARFICNSAERWHRRLAGVPGNKERDVGERKSS